MNEEEQGEWQKEKEDKKGKREGRNDVCGFNTGVSGFQWNTGTILFTLLSGVCNELDMH